MHREGADKTRVSAASLEAYPPGRCSDEKFSTTVRIQGGRLSLKTTSSAPLMSSTPSCSSPPLQVKRVSSQRERFHQHRSGVSDEQHGTTHFNEGGASNFRLAQIMWPEDKTESLLKLSPDLRARSLTAMAATTRSNAFIVMSEDEIIRVLKGMSNREREVILDFMPPEQAALYTSTEMVPKDGSPSRITSVAYCFM